ncbi:MAG: FAD:protein FMN transferase [Eubacterium sp.]|nr:FAD:protein FMN transferase [Eubacterium sp.]
MKKKISYLLIITTMMCLCSCGCFNDGNEPYKTSFKSFDTMCSITIYDKKTSDEYDNIQRNIKTACTKFNYSFDKYIPNSFVRNFNNTKHKIAKNDNYDILKRSIELGEKTNGSFDITISPIVELWGVNTNHFKIPTDEEIKEALAKVNYRQISLNGNNVRLTGGGSIDLGAIGKGFVADKLVESLKNSNVKSAIIDLGGNIYAIGSKKGKPFKVGIEKPFSNGKLIATVKAKDTSVITAGIYQRYKKKDGKIYSHIMDPKTGKPVDNDLNSVTVISKDATAADALSTGFMVMGLERGMALANSTDGVEAVFIDKNNNLHLTNGLIQNGREISLK